jgi:hypothetical protein
MSKPTHVHLAYPPQPVGVWDKDGKEAAFLASTTAPLYMNNPS